MTDEDAQPFLVDVLAKKYPDSQMVREWSGGYWRIILPSAMNHDAVYMAALFKVRLPGGFAMYQRQVIGEFGDGPDRHAVRDENNRHATSSGRQIECDPVRVAVARHDCQAETPASEEAKVSRVVAYEFDDAEHLKEIEPSVELPRRFGEAVAELLQAGAT